MSSTVPVRLDTRLPAPVALPLSAAKGRSPISCGNLLASLVSMAGMARGRLQLDDFMLVEGRG